MELIDIVNENNEFTGQIEEREIAYEKGFKVNITTNGTLLKKTREILLKSKSLRQINISLHSFEANDNNITFDEYFNEITSFVNEANEKTNIICALCF